MFSKSSKSQSSASLMSATGVRNAPFSLLGSDVHITGDIAASADLHIDGKVDGDISCATLVQGPESQIKGHVRAQTARLAGLVEGSITADELVIESTARVTGDISYTQITIATGGKVEGKCTARGPQNADGAELKLVGG